MLVACALVVGPQWCCCAGVRATDSRSGTGEHQADRCSCCPTSQAAEDCGDGSDRHPDGSSCPCRAPHKRAVAARDAAAGMPRHQELTVAAGMCWGAPPSVAIETVAEVTFDLESHAGPPSRGGRELLHAYCVLRL